MWAEIVTSEYYFWRSIGSFLYQDCLKNQVLFDKAINQNNSPLCHKLSLCEKCPNTEFFLVCIFWYLDWIRENMGQKKLRIGTIFKQYIYLEF